MSQNELKKLRESLKKQIQTNKIEISKIERTLRDLKRKNSKLEVKVAEVNGEIIKNNNGGKDIPVYFCDTKGMI
ncbi:hypothetical protein VSU16_05275 [Cetobacterium somerae]|uniref:hypothetical protein n=1 Tax=Cetobacterium somerae TaxID=188913 RepID=UPI002E7ADDFE|nr:hypothetical protein [Cetobacterium somerae]WVJ02157.1 hypothetical protein VSU16_05275 [Cetobacterium somerae]